MPDGVGRELDALPDRIDLLESEQKQLGERLTDPSLYQRSPQDVAGINTRLAQIEAELAAAMIRWEELAARAG